MVEHQEHFSRRFYKDHKTGYWISTDYPRIRAHRWVWINNFGVIPKKFHIHHKDINKSNNVIENLKLVSPKEHIRLHYTEERRQADAKWMDVIRPLTKAWHGSKEGLAWHKAHGILVWRERKSFVINCKQCGIEVITKTTHQKFCHQNCKAKYRRASLRSKSKR